LPHAPQSVSLLFRSTQPPPQSVWPVGQLLMQVELEQSSSGWQAMPHAPQFAGSLVVSMHWSVQFMSMAGHVHVPISQVICGSAQAVPQAPQFCVSVWTSTQFPPPQSTSGSMHIDVHVPLSQTWLGSHALPHAPQLLTSVVVSTH
jgi:hypothetical protein